MISFETEKEQLREEIKWQDFALQTINKQLDALDTRKRELEDDLENTLETYRGYKDTKSTIVVQKLRLMLKLQELGREDIV